MIEETPTEDPSTPDPEKPWCPNRRAHTRHEEKSKWIWGDSAAQSRYVFHEHCLKCDKQMSIPFPKKASAAWFAKMLAWISIGMVVLFLFLGTDHEIKQMFWMIPLTFLIFWLWLCFPSWIFYHKWKKWAMAQGWREVSN